MKWKYIIGTFLFLFSQNLSAQDFSGYAVMHNGDTLHAKVIRHVWTWDKKGVLKIMDYDGNHHEILDKDYKYYSTRNRMYVPIAIYDDNKQMEFFLLMQRVTFGAIEVYYNLDREAPELYIRSSFYNGYYTRKVRNEVLLPRFKTCPEFYHIFPNGKIPLRFPPFIRSIQQYNKLCY
ncbi:MAG: hypothetical protein MH137_07945 [Flavobacteriales bacterium]|nr:hypothetical protein [Flavobacteriales bacterium]